MRFFLYLSLCLFIALECQSQTTIKANEAKDYIGQYVKVCDTVFNTYQSEKETNFLNFGGSYPNQEFSVVIFKRFLRHFSYSPHEFLNGKSVCITGTVKLYRDKPQIVVEGENEIETNR